MLLIILVLMLLTFSQIGFTSTAPSSTSVVAAAKSTVSTYFVDGIASYTMSNTVGFLTPELACRDVVSVLNSKYAGTYNYSYVSSTTSSCSVTSTYVSNGSSRGTDRFSLTVYGTTVSYTCSSGTLSDSSGNPSSTGQYCSVTSDLTCAQIAANGSYELGSGWSVAGSNSTQCIQANASHACVISNNQQSIWFGKITDSCSIAMGAGAYWSYTGADCSSVGSSANYYSTFQAASSKCITPVTSTTSGATSTTSGATSTDTPLCPWGSGTASYNGQSITVCLDKPTETTPTTSSAGSTTGTDSTSSAGSTTGTNSTSSAGSTTNNSTTTNNNSSSTTGSTTGSTSGAGSTTGSASGASSTCSDGDDSIACAKLGTVSDASPLVPTEVNFGYTPDAAWWGGSGGSCPAEYKISEGISMSYEPQCKSLTAVRPVLLGICALISAGILFGFRRNGGDD